ncbi:MAG: LysM peptidoglycan-binding domain-containing protein [Proteobacteria bacterium]|nr:LysM peptidoglycan-binding domain-containing protein [Pseudomonadota bacterium]
MKPKDQPESKISTTQTNTNQKRDPRGSEDMDMGSSLLKKNEFTMIIAGALVVTIIVFLVFFKSSGPKPHALPSTSSPSGTGGESIDMENRIQAIESVLEKLQAQGPISSGDTPEAQAELTTLGQKVQRIETSVSVKFDSLTERMGNLEKELSLLDQKMVTAPLPAKIVSSETAPQRTLPKAPVKKAIEKPEKKSSMFHTVQKGETLWSISQKYKTSVATIRKLNNMSPDATIYPGTNILVR